MALELIAPAKLNLVLEITGKRADGYHDIASVMQTIDLADRVRLTPAPSISLQVSGPESHSVPVDAERNLGWMAAKALAQAAGAAGMGAHIGLEKHVPAGMGLGGGSSDAAAVLRGLNRLWDLGLEPEALVEIAATVGSDVSFFVWGGAALVTGRGERVELIPDGMSLWLTLFVPNVELLDKTRLMYSTLSPGDFTDGMRARTVAERIGRMLPLAVGDFYNAFDGHLSEVVTGLDAALARCRESGLQVVAAGSGPAFFSPTPRWKLPVSLLGGLERDFGVRTISCRSLSGAEAAEIREV
ncbi:MAG TPA: 4-(cytidine 5'-diphospho)-2-C-methyl-D-erythritol kinase [Dehalococcoidia bacterium]|nr:4-(cytidine 5'-diphospho)-2-C-methyl-D-erythritol kinase [Dehalococcoidia bacterium]